MSERREREGLHIGTMTQTEQDVAMIGRTLQAFINEGHHVGDSLGALGRLAERAEGCKPPFPSPSGAKRAGSEPRGNGWAP